MWNQNLSSYWNTDSKTSLVNTQLGSKELVSSYQLFSELMLSIPLKIKKRLSGRRLQSRGCQASLVPILPETLVAEVIATHSLPFPQHSPLSSARCAHLCLQGEISFPRQQFFCMHEKAEVKSAGWSNLFNGVSLRHIREYTLWKANSISNTFPDLRRVA